MRNRILPFFMKKIIFLLQVENVLGFILRQTVHLPTTRKQNFLFAKIRSILLLWEGLLFTSFFHFYISQSRRRAFLQQNKFFLHQEKSSRSKTFSSCNLQNFCLLRNEQFLLLGNFLLCKKSYSYQEKNLLSTSKECTSLQEYFSDNK